MRLRGLLPLAVAALAAAPIAAATGSPPRVAPGAPGAKVTWAPADKHGFGTSTSTASKVWFTLEAGELTEVYYPRLDTPSYRDLQFVITAPHGLVEQERDSTVQRTELVDPRSLTYRQIDTDRRGRWRLTKTYVTDPARATVAINVRFQSLTGRPYRLYLLAHPQLANGQPESGSCTPARLLARGGAMAAAVVSAPTLTRASCGYAQSASDGWTQLSRHHRLIAYAAAPNGNVVETGLTSLTGTRGHQLLEVALGFGTTPAGAISTARTTLRTAWSKLQRHYQAGWHAYLASLHRPPSSLASAAERREYTVSEMVLAASEDKTYRGAFVASPTMPWEWGTGLQTPSGPYHLVWARDLYEIATALIADGDTSGAQRALRFLFDYQQEPDGSFPQNSDVNGAPVGTNLQLDEVADPIILAWQLGQRDPATWSHVKRAADFIVGWHDDQGHAAPYTPQERWENQAGYSPATIAAEIAGLVCAADLAQANGDSASAARYLATADAWRAHLNGWTLTTTGPYGPAYYLRLTKDGNPNAGTTYSVGDSGPTLDQRRIVDPSFLELVRLGVEPANDPNIVATLHVVDAQLGVATPRGEFWHRYTGDGYGEERDGSPWRTKLPDGSQITIGRAWPIFAGERGEYELAAGLPAAARLAAMAAAANDVGLLPEQVWDQNPPAGKPGFASGTPTTSATPLEWTHAQFIRLAWSIASGRVIEQPAVVACRYVRHCG